MKIKKLMLKKIFAIAALFVIVVHPPVLHAGVITPITDNTLITATQEVTQLMKRHKYAMYAFTAAAAAQTGLQVYTLYRFFVPSQTSQEMLDGIKSEITKKESELELIQQKLDVEYKKIPQKPFYLRVLPATGNAIKNTASYVFSVNTAKLIFQLGFAFNMSLITNKLQEYFMHPDTINWYILYDAPYEQYCDGIIQTILNIHEIQIKEDVVSQQAQLHAALIALCQKLQQSVIRLSGFMGYKINSIDEKNPESIQKHIALQASQRYTRNLINAWTVRASKSITSGNYLDVSVATIELKAQLTKQIQQFALIDDEQDFIRELMLEFYKG